MPRKPRPQVPSQRWMTFVRNHAKAMIATDFFVVVTATFRLVYVLVIMEIGTRRIRHCNVTLHPTAEWTLQQFRECVTGEEGYRFVIHDRDSIYSADLDSSLKALGLTVLKTAYRAPQANAVCERMIGSARRECLDFMIPLDEKHVRRILKAWISHYNGGRPHSSLGPGIPSQCRRKASLRSNAITLPNIIVFWQRRYSEVFTTSTNSKECWRERRSSHQRKLEVVFAHDTSSIDG
jgi:putative transposase